MLSIYLSDLDLVPHNILSFSVDFSSISWSHVKCDGNPVTHGLAKLIPIEVEQVWENYSPMEVAPLCLDRFIINGVMVVCFSPKKKEFEKYNTFSFPLQSTPKS